MTFNDLLKSRVFWVLVVGVIVYIAKFFYPAFPMTEDQVLGLVLFVLGLLNIQPELRNRGLIKK